MCQEERKKEDASIQWPEDYIKKRGGRLITAIRNNTNDTRISRMTITRKQKWEEKTMDVLSDLSEISHEKTWTWLRKGNLRRKTESLLIAAQINATRTNHIKTRIDKTQHNSRCRLCGDRDETINHIISKCRKLAQKGYKTRHDWVVKVIHWEQCKKLKFHHTNKWYMHNPESVLKNETPKLLWDFQMQTYPLISARRTDLIIITKKEITCWNVDFAVPANQ